MFHLPWQTKLAIIMCQGIFFIVKLSPLGGTNNCRIIPDGAHSYASTYTGSSRMSLTRTQTEWDILWPNLVIGEWSKLLFVLDGSSSLIQGHLLRRFGQIKMVLGNGAWMGWEGAVIGALVEQDADWGHHQKSRLVEHGGQWGRTWLWIGRYKMVDGPCPLGQLPIWKA